MTPDRHEFSDQEELDRMTASVARDGRILRTMWQGLLIAAGLGGLWVIYAGVKGLVR